VPTGPDGGEAQTDPALAPPTAAELQGLAPRYYLKALKVPWQTFVKSIYDQRCKQYNAVVSLGDQREALKPKLRPFLIRGAALEATITNTFMLLLLPYLALIVVLFPAVMIYAGIGAYIASASMGGWAVISALAGSIAALLLGLTIFYVIEALPSLPRLSGVQTVLLSVAAYLLLTHYSVIEVAQIASAAVAIIVLPVRLGFRKLWVKIILTPFIAATVIAYFLNGYSGVMTAAGLGVLVAIALTFLLTLSYNALYWWRERHDRLNSPETIIANRLLMTLAAFEVFTGVRPMESGETFAPYTFSFSPRPSDADRRTILDNLREVVQLFSDSMPKSLNVAETTLDSAIESRCGECAANVREVALAVAFPAQDSTTTRQTLRRMFINAVTEKWGEFKASDKDKAMSKLDRQSRIRQLVGQTTAIIAVVAAIVALQALKVPWLTDTLRTYLSLALASLALQLFIAEVFPGSVASMSFLKSIPEFLNPSK